MDKPKTPREHAIDWATAAERAEARTQEVYSFQWDKRKGPNRIVRYHADFAKSCATESERWKAVADFVETTPPEPDRERYLHRENQAEGPIEFLQRVYKDDLATGVFFQDMLRSEDRPLNATIRKVLTNNRNRALQPQWMNDLVPIRVEDGFEMPNAQRNELERLEDRMRLHLAKRAPG